MSAELLTLFLSAITVSFLHTATGPDHYLPFVVLSRSKKWPVSKTLAWTAVCGLGHIASSLLLGGIGLWFGWQLSTISWLQNVRGNLSGWFLLVVGILYLGWGIRKAISGRQHKHFDSMGDGELYVYEHQHGQPIVYPQQRVRVTPWVLFAVFVMGPSEPLLPLLFYTGSRHSYAEIGAIISIFTLTTIGTMLLMVMLGIYGYSFFKTERIERYVHAIGGLVITVCGVGMVFLNW